MTYTWTQGPWRACAPGRDPGPEWRPESWQHCLACVWLQAGKAERNPSLLPGRTIGMMRTGEERVRKGGVESPRTDLQGVGWGAQTNPLEKGHQGLKSTDLSGWGFLGEILMSLSPRGAPDLLVLAGTHRASSQLYASSVSSLLSGKLNCWLL